MYDFPILKLIFGKNNVLNNCNFKPISNHFVTFNIKSVLLKREHKKTN